MSANTAYDNLILAESALQSYWKLDEASGSPADSKGSLTGTATGTFTYAQTGPTQGGVYLGDAILSNGASATRFTFGNNYSFTGTAAWSIEFWINRGTDGDARVASKYDESLGNGYFVAISGSKLYAQRHDGSGTETITGSTTLSASTWYHCVATYDGSNLRLYVNGVSDATAVASTRSIGSVTSKPFTLFATADTAQTGGVYYLGGSLKNAAVYNAALSAAAIKSHYFLRSGSDAISFTDSTVKGDGTEGGHAVRARTGADAISFTDAGAKRATPPARTALGSEVAIFTSNGSPNTFGAHYAFGMTVPLPDGKTLLSIARKASSHASYDGVIVMKTSTDDGATWSSESTILDERAGSWDWRDFYIKVLASGRLALTGGRRKTSGGLDYSQAPFLYSDDNGATWSSVTLLADAATGCFAGTLGSIAGGSYGNDLVELANGDLLMFGYGVTSSSTPTRWDLFVSKSTNGGTSWTALSKPATWSDYSFNTVEPQAELMSNGDLYLTFHIESGSPNAYYRVRSQNSGTSWGTKVAVQTTVTVNRQGLSVFADDRLISSVQVYSATKFGYYETYNGNDFGSLVDVAASLVGGASLGFPLWIMVTALGGTGDSQNVGFTYGAESSAQTSASQFYRQFTGTNGAAVYRRGQADALAFTDAGVRGAVTRPRTGADNLSFTDTATRTFPASFRTGTDALSFTDTAARSSTPSNRTGADTLTLTDTATRGAVTRSRSGADAISFTDAGASSFTHAGATLTLRTQEMVPGTVIGAYLRREWRGNISAKLNAGPGSVVATSTIDADSTVTFEGLPDGQFVAFAPAYPNRRLYFFVNV